MTNVTKWMKKKDGSLYSKEGWIEGNKFCYNDSLGVCHVPFNYYYDNKGGLAADLLIDINIEINKLEEKRKFILSQL